MSTEEGKSRRMYLAPRCNVSTFKRELDQTRFMFETEHRQQGEVHVNVDQSHVRPTF